MQITFQSLEMGDMAKIITDFIMVNKFLIFVCKYYYLSMEHVFLA